MKICTNCNAEISQNYCPKCGHPSILKRIDGLYVFQEFLNVLNFEKGFLFTVRELALDPGKSMIDFLQENRNKLVKPLVFLIVSSLIYTIINNFFHFEDGYIDYSDSRQSVALDIIKWMQRNYGYSNIIMALFIGVWMKILFKKFQFNYFEILVVLCFVMGMEMLVYSFFGFIQGLMRVDVMPIAVIVGFFTQHLP